MFKTTTKRQITRNLGRWCNIPFPLCSPGFFASPFSPFWHQTELQTHSQSHQTAETSRSWWQWNCRQTTFTFSFASFSKKIRTEHKTQVWGLPYAVSVADVALCWARASNQKKKAQLLVCRMHFMKGQFSSRVTSPIKVSLTKFAIFCCEYVCSMSGYARTAEKSTENCRLNWLQTRFVRRKARLPKNLECKHCSGIVGSLASAKHTAVQVVW